MNIKTGKIAEIYERKSSSFYLGKILNKSNSFIYFREISIRGDYSGYVLMSINSISSIKYFTKYVKFYSKVLDDFIPTIMFENVNSFIDYCYKNGKVFELSKKRWKDTFIYLKVLEISDLFFVGQKIGEFGQIKKTIKVNYSDINWLCFDTTHLKCIELFLSKKSKAT